MLEESIQARLGAVEFLALRARASTASLTLAGDVTGLTSNTTVVNLTGSGGTVGISATNFRIAAATASPVWSQLTSTTGAGTDWQLNAQAALAASGGAGGNLKLKGGVQDGAGAAGAVQLFAGATQVAQYGFATTDFVALGATPTATVGLLRLPNAPANSIMFRNAANNNNIPALTVDASNVIVLGSALANVQVPYGLIKIGASFSTVGIGVALENAMGVSGRNAANSNNIMLVIADGTNNVLVGDTQALTVTVQQDLFLTNQTTSDTIGAAGGAAALPAAPLHYLTTSVNGVSCKIPYYNP